MKTWLYATVATVALGAAAPAYAAQINFQGFTTGCFGAGCIPEITSGASSDTLLGLTYTNAAFNATTSELGDLGLGGNPGSGLNNLGTFSLNTTPNVYNGQEFNLRVVFTAPPGTTPGETIFSSGIRGSVSSTATNGGGIDIDFDNAVRNYTFTGGSFTFKVNDVSLIAGQSAAASGFIQATAVPGPIAGAGLPALLALGGFVWARRRKAQHTSAALA